MVDRGLRLGQSLTGVLDAPLGVAELLALSERKDWIAFSESLAMTSSPVEADASWPCCIASCVCWYCRVSVASMTAALAPACASTSLVRMSTRS